MFGIRTRALTGLTFLASACGLATTAQAQLFPFINPCGTCAPPPMVMSTAAVCPPPVQVVSAAVCETPLMQPVVETVYQDVQQVEYRDEQRTVQVPKVITVMEERPVTTFQTVNETRTVNVPSYVNQTVTECQTVTQNQSYWRTNWQPVPKMTPCAYDSRPGLLAEMNRRSYAMRSAFTPNHVAQREFVPNVVTAQVPVQRTVQVPTTRQVTYNVARSVPVQTTQKVAVQKTVWEDQVVVAKVPFTTTKRVAVGTRTTMAYVNPNGTTTASAEPTPATTANGNSDTQSASGDKGATRLQSSPTSTPPLQHPTYRQEAAPQQQPQSAPAPVANGSDSDAPALVAGGWKATRQSVAKQNGDEKDLTVAKK